MSQSHARAAFSQLRTAWTRAARECERNLPEQDPSSAGEAIAAIAA